MKGFFIRITSYGGLYAAQRRLGISAMQCWCREPAWAKNIRVLTWAERTAWLPEWAQLVHTHTQDKNTYFSVI